MIKVCECSLCGKYYRTGQVRQVIEKAMGEGNKWVEWRKAVCNNCYKVIIKGEGVASVGISSGSWDVSNWATADSKGYIDKLNESVDGKGRERILKEATPKKERKPRGKRVKSDKSLGAETIEDIAKKIEQIKTVKEEPKKRGRKPKLVTAEAIREKTYHEDTVQNTGIPPSTDFEVVDKVTGVPIIEESKPVEPVENIFIPAEESEPINAKDRNTLKNQVRQALENNPEVLYSKIAEKLGIDEGLVSQLVDELELEAAG